MNKELKVDHSSLQEVWAWDSDKGQGVKTRLAWISNGTGNFLCVSEHEQAVYFDNCEPYNNQDNSTRLMTHAEIFKAIRGGAVVRFIYQNGVADEATNTWSTNCRPGSYQICYNYTGAESDKWEKMEVGV